jgi:hypothetical protein
MSERRLKMAGAVGAADAEQLEPIGRGTSS